MLTPVVSPEAVAAGRQFQQQFLQELPGLMGQPGEALRHHAAWYSSENFALRLYQHVCMWPDTNKQVAKAVRLVKIVFTYYLHHLQTVLLDGSRSFVLKPQLEDMLFCSCGSEP